MISVADREEVIMCHREDAMYIRWEEDCWYRAESGKDVLCSNEDMDILEAEYQAFLKNKLKEI